MPAAFFPEFRIIRFPETESTNTSASEWIKKGMARHGDIYLANYQTAGRGQHSHTWFSSPGKNILCSIVFGDQGLKTDQIPLLNMLVSMAVYSTLRGIPCPDIKVKWPNDILAGGQKIAGILIETILQGNRIKWVTAGIGINVNEENFPKDIPNATSILKCTGQAYDTEVLLSALTDHLNQYMSELFSKPPEEIRKNYESVMYGLNTQISFRSGDQHFTGKITGINAAGQLCLQTTDGTQTFNHKEIEFDLSSH